MAGKFRSGQISRQANLAVGKVSAGKIRRAKFGGQLGGGKVTPTRFAAALFAHLSLRLRVPASNSLLFSQPV
ncbi:MAG: hypothetical protein V2I33_17825, partial [Kangiellaceae bacterium]|nr:hypothetical protein [Kangiellaceae bacterium]